MAVQSENVLWIVLLTLFLTLGQIKGRLTYQDYIVER